MKVREKYEENSKNRFIEQSIQYEPNYIIPFSFAHFSRVPTARYNIDRLVCKRMSAHTRTGEKKNVNKYKSSLRDPNEISDVYINIQNTNTHVI